MSTRRDDSVGLVEPTDDGMVAFIEQFQAPLPAQQVSARDLHKPAVTVLQPHPDDAALSIGGTLLGIMNPLTLVTVYSQSANSAITDCRRAEDHRFAHAVGATVDHLGLHEQPSASALRSEQEIAAITSQVQTLLPADNGVVAAPAGVSRHVDHVAVHTACRAFDVVVWWEDVAFWGIYAASVEDRVLFADRSGGWLDEQVLVAVDISSAVWRKASLLACYRSQSDEYWRPLRYSWAAAAEVGRRGYCERLFISRDQLDATAEALNLRLGEGPVIQYGTVPVSTAWATIRGIQW